MSFRIQSLKAIVERPSVMRLFTQTAKSKTSFKKKKKVLYVFLKVIAIQSRLNFFVKDFEKKRRPKTSDLDTISIQNY